MGLNPWAALDVIIDICVLCQEQQTSSCSFLLLSEASVNSENFFKRAFRMVISSSSFCRPVDWMCCLPWVSRVTLLAIYYKKSFVTQDATQQVGGEEKKTK